jgi:hypothetical protein
VQTEYAINTISQHQHQQQQLFTDEKAVNSKIQTDGHQVKSFTKQ